MNVIKQTPNLLVLQNRRQAILIAFYLALFLPAIVVGLWFYFILLERWEKPLEDAIGRLGMLLLLVLVIIVIVVLQYLRLTSFTSSRESSTTRQIVQIGMGIVESLLQLVAYGLFWMFMGYIGRVILLTAVTITNVIVLLLFPLFFPYVTCILDREYSRVTIKRGGLLRTTIIEHSLSEVSDVMDIDPLMGVTSLILILESGQELPLLPLGLYLSSFGTTKQETVEIVRQFLRSNATC